MTVLMLGASAASMGQSSNSGMELHANGGVTATDIGLPAYPGATLYKEPGSKSDSVDLGFTFGDVHFRIVAASYLSGASAGQILDFYRKPMAKYGEVLECDHGKAVGALKATHSGLTCSDPDHVQSSGSVDSSDDHELRAGDKHKFRVVGIGDKKGDSTRFGLVYVELPKDDEKKD
jgi:hypothetical protein